VDSFSPNSNAAAGALSPGAPGGLGVASGLRRLAVGGARVPSPLADQEEWFAREVLPHEPALRAWLWRHHPGLKEELDDIVQESYFRLLRARAAGPVRCARTYLFGIARHVALGIHRAQRHTSATRVNDLPETATMEENGDVVAMVTHRQELALTAAAIARLPDRCREVVTLHTVEGLSYREVAARLGLAEETVRVQMARAVKKCIAFLRERGGGEGEGL
jgi:RNA polymerase sigma factor (sigma-70 family)